ncbi:MAG TPA: protein translocase subunit SecD [Solirubrobacteraceae bacterium]|nr:protein translocase subunit SecD [Solirubrobacteraceae bacterium]
MTDRRRNAFVLAIVVGLLIASLVIEFGFPGVTKAKKTTLGLDLKGGVELVYQGEPTAQSPVDSTSLSRAIDIIRQRVDAIGVSQPEIQTTGNNEIDVALPAVKDATTAEQQVGEVAQLYFYDWEPNVIGPTGTADPTNASVTGGLNGAGNPAYGVSLYKAVILASKRPEIKRKSDTTLGNGIDGIWYLVNEKTQTVLRGPDATQAALTGESPAPKGSTVIHIQPGTVIVQAETPNDQPDTKLNSYYVLNDDPALSGKDIKNPQQAFDNGAGGTGQPNVTFDFTSGGRKTFEAVTKRIAQRGAQTAVLGNGANQHFAIVLDNRLISVPSIDYTQYPEGIDAASGSEISGGFTITSAQTLAQLLQTGALPIGLKLISAEQVSATLGKQALNQGLVAGGVGFVVVAVFLLLFYRVLGMIAVTALLVYALYFYALIKMIPITLSLPGIAGLILTIGVAADANIVIFERVKEEFRGGSSIGRAIATGYKRGIAAIIDANVVTFMTAFILFVLATAEVKGFAFTLGIGTLVSLFTAVAATQAILGVMGRSRLIGTPSALGAKDRGRRWSYDFMGASKWFFSLSGTILLIGALAIAGHGLNFGIDFQSGTQIKTALTQPATENGIRQVMIASGVSDAQIQKVTSKALGKNAFQISTQKLLPANVPKIQAALQKRFGNTVNFSSTSIGPTFGATVAKQAIIAIIASLLVISVYIALRFEWKYAIPVLIALMHDLLITAGVYSLTGRQVTTSTVAALLTILGYSLYDTIIVFDRVRENVPRMPRAAFSQIVNRSMSEVLTRSMATTFCTLLPIASLLLFGGDTLKDFAFALLVGVASGAYSSIFIASPVLTHWKEREPAYARRRARIAAENGGVVPPYALTGSAAVEVDPTKGRRRRTGRLTTPDHPEQGISRAEFQELVQDLDVEESLTPKTGGVRASRTKRGGTPAPAPAPAVKRKPAPPPAADPRADATPEDVVMPDAPKPPAKPRTSKSKPRRGHGRPR